MKKLGFLVKFGSVGSIIRSIRSITCRWAMVDRPGLLEFTEPHMWAHGIEELIKELRNLELMLLRLNN